MAGKNVVLHKLIEYEMIYAVLMIAKNVVVILKLIVLIVMLDIY